MTMIALESIIVVETYLPEECEPYVDETGRKRREIQAYWVDGEWIAWCPGCDGAAATSDTGYRFADKLGEPGEAIDKALDEGRNVLYVIRCGESFEPPGYEVADLLEASGWAFKINDD